MYDNQQYKELQFIVMIKQTKFHKLGEQDQEVHHQSTKPKIKDAVEDVVVKKKNQLLIKIKPMKFEERLINNCESVNILDRESLMMNDPDEVIDYDQLDKSQFMRFDRIYNVNSTNTNIFIQEIQTQIKSILEGQNNCFFCYGGNNSGKTHTMIGSVNDNGILVQFINSFYNYIEVNRLRDVKVEMSIFEYSFNDFVDLIAISQSKLYVREKKKGLKELIGSSRISVQTKLEAQQLVRYALFNSPNRDFESESYQQNRLKLPKTHLFIEFYVSTFNRFDNIYSWSKAVFVDLGGIELNQMQKIGSIHESMLCFTNCVQMISEISQNVRKNDDIPFKQTKFTNYLEDSLSGFRICTIGHLNLFYPMKDIQISCLRQLNLMKNMKTSQEVNSVNLNEIEFNFRLFEQQYIKFLKMYSYCLGRTKIQQMELYELSCNLMVELYKNIIEYVNSNQTIKHNKQELNRLQQQYYEDKKMVLEKVFMQDDSRQFYLQKIRQKYRLQLCNQDIMLINQIEANLTQLTKQCLQQARILKKIEKLKQKQIEVELKTRNVKNDNIKMIDPLIEYLQQLDDLEVLDCQGQLAIIDNIFSNFKCVDVKQEQQDAIAKRFLKDKDQSQIMDMAILLRTRQIQNNDISISRNLDKKQKEAIENQQKIFIGSNYVLKVPFQKQTRVLESIKPKKKAKTYHKDTNNKFICQSKTDNSVLIEQLFRNTNRIETRFKDIKLQTDGFQSQKNIIDQLEKDQDEYHTDRNYNENILRLEAKRKQSYFKIKQQQNNNQLYFSQKFM